MVALAISQKLQHQSVRLMPESMFQQCFMMKFSPKKHH